jgi:hypothetical protein
VKVPVLEGVVAKRLDRPTSLDERATGSKVRPGEASFIQEVQFLRCQGLANQQQSSPALYEVTSTAKRGQSDRQAATRVKRFSPVTIQQAEADRVFEREGKSRRGLWRLRRRLRRGQRAWHVGRRMDAGTGEAPEGLTGR